MLTVSALVLDVNICILFVCSELFLVHLGWFLKKEQDSVMQVEMVCKNRKEWGGRMDSGDVNEI